MNRRFVCTTSGFNPHPADVKGELAVVPWRGPWGLGRRGPRLPRGRRCRRTPLSPPAPGWQRVGPLKKRLGCSCTRPQHGRPRNGPGSPLQLCPQLAPTMEEDLSLDFDAKRIQFISAPPRHNHKRRHPTCQYETIAILPTFCFLKLLHSENREQRRVIDALIHAP